MKAQEQQSAERALCSTGLTLCKERGEEGLGRKNLRPQHSSEKIVARLLGRPQAKLSP